MKIFAEINMQQATYKPKCDSIKLRIPRFKALTGTEKRGRKLGLALMQKYVSQWSKKVLGSNSNSCLTLRFHKIIFIIILTVLKAKNLKIYCKIVMVSKFVYEFTSTYYTTRKNYVPQVLQNPVYEAQ